MSFEPEMEAIYVQDSVAQKKCDNIHVETSDDDYDAFGLTTIDTERLTQVMTNMAQTNERSIAFVKDHSIKPAKFTSPACFKSLQSNRPKASAYRATC